MRPIIKEYSYGKLVVSDDTVTPLEGGVWQLVPYDVFIAHLVMAQQCARPVGKK